MLNNNTMFVKQLNIYYSIFYLYLYLYMTIINY